MSQVPSQRADDAWSDPDRCPDEDPSGTCDWGNCDDPSHMWRWDNEDGNWLPVCAYHGANRV